MRAKTKQPLKLRIGASCSHWLNRVVRPFGLVALPIAEINRMESDGYDNYRAMNKDAKGSEAYGYFNGLADYASKKSKQLREKYLP